MQRQLIWNLLTLVGVAIIGVCAYLALPGGPTFAPKLGWLVWCLGISLLMFAFAARGGAVQFGLVAASLLAGTAGELSLTQPLFFPSVALGLLRGVGGLGFILILFQGIVAVWVLRSFGTGLRLVLSQFGIPRTLLVLAILSVLSASIMGYAPNGHWGGYAKQIVFGTAIVVLNLLSLVALSITTPPQFFFRPPTALVSVACAVAASVILAWLAMEFVPHVEDELAYLFHARLFAAGQLWAPAPAEILRPGLDYYLLTIEGDRWFAVTTPGWPAILALGTYLGQPWLLNPLLAGIAIWLAYDTIRRIADQETALVAAMLLASSAWFLASGATLMPHLASTVLSLMAWWLLVRSRGTVPAALLAGAAMGALFTVRQLEAVILGGVTGFLLLGLAWPDRKFLPVLGYGIGCIAVGSLYFLYNMTMTGSFLTAPMEPYLDALWHDGANAYGFGPEIGPRERWGALDYAPGHSLTEGLIGAAHNVFSTNFEFLGWSIGSLGLFLAHLLWGRKNRLDILAYAIIAFTIIAHLGYWFTGSFYIGPRYWSGLMVPLAYLSARGFFTIGHRLSLPAHRMLPVLWVMVLTGLLVFVPWRGVEKYQGYGNYDGEFRRTASAQDFEARFVVYDGPRNPGVALFLNSPDLPDDRPIFLRGDAEFDEGGIGDSIMHWPLSN